MPNTQTTTNHNDIIPVANIVHMTHAELSALLFARGVGNGKIVRLTDDELREYAVRIKDTKEVAHGQY